MLILGSQVPQEICERLFNIFSSQTELLTFEDLAAFYVVFKE